MKLLLSFTILIFFGHAHAQSATSPIKVKARRKAVSRAASSAAKTKLATSAPATGSLFGSAPTTTLHSAQQTTSVVVAPAERPPVVPVMMQPPGPTQPQPDQTSQMLNALAPALGGLLGNNNGRNGGNSTSSSPTSGNQSPGSTSPGGQSPGSTSPGGQSPGSTSHGAPSSSPTSGTPPGGGKAGQPGSGTQTPAVDPKEFTDALCATNNTDQCRTIRDAVKTYGTCANRALNQIASSPEQIKGLDQYCPGFSTRDMTAQSEVFVNFVSAVSHLRTVTKKPPYDKTNCPMAAGDATDSDTQLKCMACESLQLVATDKDISTLGDKKADDPDSKYYPAIKAAMLQYCTRSGDSSPKFVKIPDQLPQEPKAATK